VSDPFEEPKNAELVLDGTQDIEKSIDQIYKLIYSKGYLEEHHHAKVLWWTILQMIF